MTLLKLRGSPAQRQANSQHPAPRPSQAHPGSGSHRLHNKPATHKRQTTAAIRAAAKEAPLGSPLYLGLDFGTSGARAAVIDDGGRLVQDVKMGYGDGAAADWAGAWQRVLFELIGSLDPAVRAAVAGVAFDGTSATAMLVDPRVDPLAAGRDSRVGGAPGVLAPPKLYNEAQGKEAVAAAKAMAPPAHTATAPTSTLCKLITWHTAGLTAPTSSAATSTSHPLLLHQADWLAALLHGRYGVTDWNNALKLGYDPETESYPDWLTSQPFAHLLPRTVVAPGAPVAPLTPAAAAATGLPPSCVVCGGTTDSIAAFVAAGASEAGQAVTSLGSTLAVKLLSTTRLDDAAYGIYSHRLGDVWLVGGASNSGGAVLRQFFSDARMRELTPRLDPGRPTGLGYYPLPQGSKGERFPVADPELLPRMEPRPEDDAMFFQGLLEGIADIEAQAYRRLSDMGASPLKEVLTAGGGAANPKWTEIRQRLLGVPVRASEQGEACYGAALLARQGAKKAAAGATATAAAAAAAAGQAGAGAKVA